MALPAPYQQMALADELLDRPDELQASYERDGYLFFHGVLDRAEVDRVAGELLEAMRAEELVDPPPDGSRPARWSGRPLDAIDDSGFYELSYYPELLDTATTQRFLRRIIEMMARGVPAERDRMIELTGSAVNVEATSERHT